MCRYGMYGPYKEKWACFECRKSFKQVSRYRLGGKMRDLEDDARLVPCPQCRRQMHNMGLDFKAPRTTDRKQWRKVELLFENGIRFSSCGCGGPGPRPARLNEVGSFLEALDNNALKWERSARVTERSEELRLKRKKKRERLENKRMDKIIFRAMNEPQSSSFV